MRRNSTLSFLGRLLPLPAAPLLGLVVLILLSPGAASADHHGPLLDLDDGSALPQGTPAVIGWEFTISSLIVIQGLGFWDEGGDGLAVVHEVGLWNGGGSTLLVSTSVGNFDTPVGSSSQAGVWRFASIRPLFLFPGNYVVGATVADLDLVRTNFLVPMQITTIPELSYVAGGRWKGGTSVLEYPPDPFPFPSDLFGPNLLLGVNEVNVPTLAPMGMAVLVAILSAVGAVHLSWRGSQRSS